MTINDRIKFLRKRILSLNQYDFSVGIGFDQSYISQVENGKREPSEKFLMLVANKYEVSLDWIKTGYGEIKKNAAVGQPKDDYDLHGGWKPRSIEQMAGVPEGLGMGQAVEMLARIYQSKNPAVISAICANLRVFCERIAQEDEIADLKRDVDELRGLIKNHARAHAYYGEDRRSGVDRRQVEGLPPCGGERRSGIERRKAENGATE